ncbi:helix-turn-helix domain-containing protein [Methylobacterium fujisawaense]|uniref:helix-turn-helix domain-containing protein n=1 Tax=Methylobacterium fujisawaense TaxID=107400 RepID=UPI00313E6799
MEQGANDAYAEPDAPEPAEVGSTFGEWLQKELTEKGMTLGALAEKSGITRTGIWNIVKGNTKSPRPETRAKLAEALEEKVPAYVEAQIESEAAAVPGFVWNEFTPSDLETVPPQGGVYVFYDITDRPVYVGQSSKNVRARVKDHQTRFWFKHPLVVRGAFLAIPDPALCLQIETILIKFLGKHALLNVRGAIKDLED